MKQVMKIDGVINAQNREVKCLRDMVEQQAKTLPVGSLIYEAFAMY